MVGRGTPYRPLDIQQVPHEVSPTQPGDPAYREDPSQPVPESARPKLKRSNRGQIDKSCFIYVKEEDQYYCPMGQAMPFAKSNPIKSGAGPIDRRIYRCPNCDGCVLLAACVSAKNLRGRTISRDVHEEVRERTAARMSTDAARELYHQRPRIAETPFAILKSVMGIRQFLLRGLEKVKTEWLWGVTAFNLRKLVCAIVAMRADLEKLETAGVNW